MTASFVDVAEAGDQAEHQLVQLHEKARHRSTTSPARSWSRWIAAGVAVGYVVVQVVWILRVAQGPFLDEGIYATAGMRTLHGFGISDGYQSWFAGSLVWPVLSGAAYQLGGLEAARLLATGCVVLAGWGSVSAARRLFGDGSACWTALLVFASAPALLLGHLAVYDVLAAAGLGGALWCVVMLHRSDNRGWLVGVSSLSALAILSKYPVALLVVWLMVLMVALRRRRGVTDVAITSMVLTGMLLAYVLPFRSQLAQFVSWRTANDPGFGVTRQMIGAEQAELLLPLAVVLVLGLLAVPRGLRLPATVMVSALFLFPAYHLVVGNSVSASKHAFFGILVAAPVGGAALQRLTSRWHYLTRPATALLLGGFAVSSALLVRTTDHGWVDMRPATDYLAVHMNAGDSVLSSNSWPVVAGLYRDGLINGPDQITDGWAMAQNRRAVDWCDFDWVVDERNGTGWTDAQRAAIRACGTYRRVLDAPSEMIGLGRQLRYVHWQADAVVYERIGAR